MLSSSGNWSWSPQRFHGAFARDTAPSQVSASFRMTGDRMPFANRSTATRKGNYLWVPSPDVPPPGSYGQPTLWQTRDESIAKLRCSELPPRDTSQRKLLTPIFPKREHYTYTRSSLSAPDLHAGNVGSWLPPDWSKGYLLEEESSTGLSRSRVSPQPPDLGALMREHMRGGPSLQSFKTVAHLKARARGLERVVTTRHKRQEQRAHHDAKAAERSVLLAQRVLKSRERISDMLGHMQQALPPQQAQFFRQPAAVSSEHEMVMAEQTDETWQYANVASERRDDVLAVRPVRHASRDDADEQLRKAHAMDEHLMQLTLTSGVMRGRAATAVL